MGPVTLLRRIIIDSGSMEGCPDCGQHTLPAENRCPDCIELGDRKV